MIRTRRLIQALFLLLTLSMAGCTFVRIQNVAASSATVSVQVPDSGKPYTRIIRSGGIVDVFSSHGGRYTVTMIPSEAYRETLFSLQTQITQRLFNERATLTAEDVRQLTENLNHIDRLIEEMARPGQSCAGNVPDFDTAIVVLAFDELNSDWSLSCSSGSE